MTMLQGVVSKTKLLLLFLSIVMVVLIFLILFIRECNVFQPFGYRREKCECLGAIINPSPKRSFADDTEIIDYCIGIVAKKFPVEGEEYFLKGN
jgi:hypothetical protein